MSGQPNAVERMDLQAREGIAEDALGELTQIKRRGDAVVLGADDTYSMFDFDAMKKRQEMLPPWSPEQRARAWRELAIVADHSITTILREERLTRAANIRHYCRKCRGLGTKRHHAMCPKRGNEGPRRWAFIRRAVPNSATGIIRDRFYEKAIAIVEEQMAIAAAACLPTASGSNLDNAAATFGVPSRADREGASLKHAHVRLIEDHSTQGQVVDVREGIVFVDVDGDVRDYYAGEFARTWERA